MNKKLDFVKSAFQVIVDGTLVQVLDDRPQAIAYAEAYYKGYNVVIVPIPIFSFT